MNLVEFKPAIQGSHFLSNADFQISLSLCGKVNAQSTRSLSTHSFLFPVRQEKPEKGTAFYWPLWPPPLCFPVRFLSVPLHRPLDILLKICMNFALLIWPLGLAQSLALSADIHSSFWKLCSGCEPWGGPGHTLFLLSSVRNSFWLQSQWPASKTQILNVGLFWFQILQSTKVYLSFPGET